MEFDNYAKTWDSDKRITRAKTIAEEIIGSIENSGQSSAMEFGCGTGLISFNIYDKFKSVALVDSSEEMINILKSKINKYNADNMTPYLLDLSKGDVLQNKFDVIYSSMVLHHIDDIEGIIEKLYGLLNSGGCLCIVDIDEEDGSFHKNYPEFRGHNGFNQEALKNILSKGGFKDVESNTFYYDHKIIEGEKIDYSLFLIKGKKNNN